MRILAVDLGDARTGLAVCDEGERLASPVGVVHQSDWGRLAQEIAAQCQRLGAGQVVMGLPVNMDGSRGPRAQLYEKFAARLEQACGLPVVLWDERATTQSAHALLNITDTRGKKRKQVVDAVAAVLILESYLAFRANRQH